MDHFPIRGKLIHLSLDPQYGLHRPPLIPGVQDPWDGQLSLALFNHEELERLQGQEPNDPHQRFLWRIIRMGVIDPEVADKPMDASTRSMRHSSAIGMRLWKMWREAES